MTSPPRLPVPLLAAVVLGAAALLGLALYATPALAQEAVASAGAGIGSWAVIAAAIAASFSTLAAGYAVAVVGSAAVGALAEKPDLLGRVLILVGLAEGIAIYGLIVAVLILNVAE